MSLRRRYFMYVALVVGAVLFSECVVYQMQAFSWEPIFCDDLKDCVRVLFVADPQIQGNTAVPPPLSILYNWDSDRYLKKTFGLAVKHFKPEILVFLGDLMDEGSIATVPIFNEYVNRLRDIFYVDSIHPNVHIWLPGDNDIGGENEPINKQILQEFTKVFRQPDIIYHKNLAIFKVNAIIQTIPQPVHISNDTIKIAVSHYPVTARRVFNQVVNNAINPDIYFCGHDHASKYVVQNKELVFRETKAFNEFNQHLEVILSEDFRYEIYVPTCSYRMGTKRMGYGGAVFYKDDNGRPVMKYTVLWSPERFCYLIVYLILLLVVCVYSLIIIIIKLMYNNSSCYNLTNIKNNNEIKTFRSNKRRYTCTYQPLKVSE